MSGRSSEGTAPGRSVDRESGPLICGVLRVKIRSSARSVDREIEPLICVVVFCVLKYDRLMG